MLGRRNIRRTVAGSAVLVMAAWGVGAMPAAADQPTDPKNEAHGKAHGKSEGKAANGQGKRDGKAAKGQQEKGDPAGNNGTVKIATLGELDGIPNNSPHPGCDFQVEWYGYDEGPDIISTVSFAMQAPTQDTALTVVGEPTVFVGEDPATGAGTETGQDGVATYTLGFDGEPHAQQGYHVKLTVETPYSHGNDTKTKVFWIEPCEGEAAAEEGVAEEGAVAEEQDEAGTTEESGLKGTEEEGEVLGSYAESQPNEVNVLGTQAEAGADAKSDEAAVPLFVAAGGSALDWLRSPLGFLALALGLALASLGAVVAARRRATDQG